MPREHEARPRPRPSRPPSSGRPEGLAGRVLAALDIGGSAGSPLPSIRNLARHCGVSANTVQRALKILAARGAVYGLPGKGYYRGAGPAPVPPLPPAGNDGPGRIAESLQADLRKGDLDPFARLPPRKALADRYRVSTRTLRKALAALETRGALIRDGRTFRFRAGASALSGSRVILVTRCDSAGGLLLEGERELDFLKAAYRESRALGLELKVAGFDPGGRLLDRQGRSIASMPGGRPILGFLVSTWLVPDVLGILARLRPYRLPVSIWWEHSRQAFAKTRFPRNVALFNLSFGERAGALVAETLFGLGHRRAVFLSPFHASAWSQQRLEGLRSGFRKVPGGEVAALVSDAHASPWTFQEEAWKSLRAARRGLAADDPKVMRRKRLNLARHVRGMLEAAPPDPEATAWVCVNDEVAEIVFAFLQSRRAGPAPYLISFDNSSASYRLGIDSFAFDAGAMVRQMLFHLTRPSAAGFPGPGLIDLEGRVERK